MSIRIKLPAVLLLITTGVCIFRPFPSASGRNTTTGRTSSGPSQSKGELKAHRTIEESEPEIAAFPQATLVGAVGRDGSVQLCQYAVPIANNCTSANLDCRSIERERARCGVQCPDGMCGCGAGASGGEPMWKASRPIPWQTYGAGEYVGPPRAPQLCEYRLRTDDLVEFVFRLTRDVTGKPYELNVGDKIKVESLTDPTLDRELLVQPDGTVTIRLLGQIRAARRTIEDLRGDLEERYRKYYKVPSITVTPMSVNTRLEDLRAAVDARSGSGGQTRQARITPEGTVALPGVGSIPAQGLTLDELKREVDERYKQLVDGIDVTPLLAQRAPRYVFVLGEVKTPGRYTLEGPTTAMQAIAMAGGWANTSNLREIVVFRRTEDWRLMATRLDLRGALLGKRPCPADEIWLRDSDLVVLPKSPIARADDFVETVFTKGIYGVVPSSAFYATKQLTSL